jgi:hypothetical protein
LGAAAAAHTLVTATLDAKRRIGLLPRIRDNALITLGHTHVEITTVLLGALHTSRLCAAKHHSADLWARLGKAHAVDAAHQAVTELAPLVGAAGFQQASRLAKTRADLTGLLYADGIHDSLYRSAGRTLLASMSGGRSSTIALLSTAGSDPADLPAAA